MIKYTRQGTAPGGASLRRSLRQQACDNKALLGGLLAIRVAVTRLVAISEEKSSLSVCRLSVSLIYDTATIFLKKINVLLLVKQLYMVEPNLLVIYKTSQLV